MKNLVTFGIFITCCFSLGIAKAKSDKERESLVGLVKSVRVESTTFSEVSGNWVEGPRLPLSSTKYDKKGNWIERIYFRKDGSVMGKFQWAYTYDSKGHVTKRINIGDGSALTGGKVINTYDDEGYLKEKIHYGENDSLKNRENFTYDKEGNIRERVIYGDDGLPITKEVFTHTYSSKGRITEKVTYDSGGGVLKSVVSKFDLVGNEIEAVEYREDKTTMVGRQKIMYDDKNNKKEVVFYNPDGSEDSKNYYKYEYDPMGNWTQKLERRVWSDSSIPPEVKTAFYRTITYYSQKNNHRTK